ncbi:MAG: hypothetical protein ACXAEU_12055 [Candidatus Hodarchaeales archaeon]
MSALEIELYFATIFIIISMFFFIFPFPIPSSFFELSCFIAFSNSFFSDGLAESSILTIAAGLTSLLIYSMEMILSSGLLDKPYPNIDLTIEGPDLLWMNLTFLLKVMYNVFGLTGCLLVSFAWTWQFSTWARFSKAPFIKTFFFVGITMIILFVVQLITTILEYMMYLPELSGESELFQLIMLILLLIAALVLPFSIYFIAMAGRRMRIPHEKEKPSSRLIVILPLIFFLLWFWVTLSRQGGNPLVASWLASLIGTLLFLAIFIPISIGFFGFARRVDSAYLRKNLYLAAIGTLALSMFGIIGLQNWAGLTLLPGYLLAFSILTWSFGNLSQHLGSREALSQRLKETGAQFVADLGDAEMKAQSVQKMATVMADVSNGFMEDLAKMAVRSPPTKKEIRRYIVSTMGMEASPTETEVMNYLKSAISFIEEIPEEKALEKPLEQ